MQVTRVLRFGVTNIVLGGKQPYGLKPSQTRKANDRKRSKNIQHIRYILHKYKKPKQWSGLEVEPSPYYPEEIVPQLKE